MVQNEHAVAAIALIDQVRRHQDRHAFLVAQLLQVQPQIVPRSGIEPDRGFVQDQQLRPMQQSLRQFHAPRQASGQRFHEIFGSIGNSQAFHHFRDAAVQLAAAQAVKLAVIAKVLQHGELLVEAGILEDNADAPADVVSLLLNVVAEDRCRSLRWRERRRKDFEERRLAAAVRAQQRKDLAPPNVETDAIQRTPCCCFAACRDIRGPDSMLELRWECSKVHALSIIIRTNSAGR